MRPGIAGLEREMTVGTWQCPVLRRSAYEPHGTGVSAGAAKSKWREWTAQFTITTLVAVLLLNSGTATWTTTMTSPAPD